MNLNEFAYVLISKDDGDLAEPAQRIASTIAEHAQKHDFAQLIYHDEIRIDQCVHCDEVRSCVVVPFTRNYFRELAALNLYIGMRAGEAHLEVVQMRLPTGDSIDLWQRPDE